jgi:hypothetical protein
MKKNKMLFLILLITFSLCILFFSHSLEGIILVLGMDNILWGREILGEKEHTVNELKDMTIMFHIDKLVTGKHDLLIYFIPYESASFEQIEKPINFEFTVQIRKGKKIKEKRFIKIFKQGNSRGIFYLFDVPDDFFWSRIAKIEIIIKDINFDEDFTQYFEKLSFNIVHLQLFGHNINVVDGEPLIRTNGFKSW